MRNVLLALPIAAALIALAASPAFAVQRVVDDDHVQCPTAPFTTIQDAVNAANPGDQVLVCNGLYREQVSVTDANIDLVSKVTLGATISPPPGVLPEPRALVHLTGSNDKVRRFRIVGPGTGTADSLRWGVLVDGNASLVAAEVSDNFISDIRDIEAAANEHGIGVQVGSFDGSVGNPGRAKVLRNTIVRYQKGGVVVNEQGSWGLVTNNTIQGLGLEFNDEPVPAQQGIQIGFGAAADVNTNKISENKYGGDIFTSFGILLVSTSTGQDPFSSAKSRIFGNTVQNNDVGIFAQDVRSWQFLTNRVSGNGDPSTPAYDSGIAIYDSGPAPPGSPNKFDRNDARTNAGFDCEDGTTGGGTGGTANIWTFNRGVDDIPPVICAP